MFYIEIRVISLISEIGIKKLFRVNCYIVPKKIVFLVFLVVPPRRARMPICIYCIYCFPFLGTSVVVLEATVGRVQWVDCEKKVWQNIIFPLRVRYT